MTHRQIDDNKLKRLTSDLESVYTETVKGRTCVIIGHSMGGAIGVHLAKNVPASGLVVVDVVEGTALEALPAMEALLRGRPEQFKNKKHAIEWAVKYVIIPTYII